MVPFPCWVRNRTCLTNRGPTSFFSRRQQHTAANHSKQGQYGLHTGSPHLSLDGIMAYWWVRATVKPGVLGDEGSPLCHVGHNNTSQLFPASLCLQSTGGHATENDTKVYINDERDKHFTVRVSGPGRGCSRWLFGHSQLYARVSSMCWQSLLPTTSRKCPKKQTVEAALLVYIVDFRTFFSVP